MSKNKNKNKKMNSAPAPEKEKEKITLDEIEVKTPDSVPTVRKDNGSEKKDPGKSPKSGKGGAAYVLKIAGVLTLICSVVALMLAVVNMVTKDRIAQNEEIKRNEAVAAIFDGADAVACQADDHDVYLAVRDGVWVGYCVSVAPEGFGGPIEMLVGITPDNAIKGIRVISMSESKGFGSRVTTDPKFLPSFVGLSGEIGLDDVDALSSATVSSTAVVNGVNEALKVRFDPSSAAKEAGYSDPVIEESEESESAETESAETEEENNSYIEPVTEAVQTDPSDGYIDPSAVGGYGEGGYGGADNKTVETREDGYFLEHETTDTESETEPETDEDGNVITEPETDEDGNPVEPADDDGGDTP